MTTKYYCVQDWEFVEPYDSYYTNKAEAIRYAKKIFKEMKEMNCEGKVIVSQFELPKMRKSELVMRLLAKYDFMKNKKDILCLEWWYPDEEEE